jgi:hypothetical protein
MNHKERIEKKIKESDEFTPEEKENLIKLWQEIAEAYETGGKNAIKGLISKDSDKIISDCEELMKQIKDNYL